MSLSLAERVLVQGPVGGPRNPRTHALCKEKATMGRPRLIEPRTKQLNLSLTPTELEVIRRGAEAVGMRPVHFGRAMLLNDRLPTPQARSAATNDDRLIYNQLVRLGNNLNQLVRHLNRTGDPVPADLEPLLADIRRIMALRAQR